MPISPQGTPLCLRSQTMSRELRSWLSIGSNDPFFHGLKFVTYKDGQTWAHVEMIQYIQDGYTGCSGPHNVVKACTAIVESIFEEDLCDACGTHLR